MLSLLFLISTFHVVLSQSCLDQATQSALAVINAWTPNGLDQTVQQIKSAIDSYVASVQYGPANTYSGCPTNVTLAEYEVCLLEGWGQLVLTEAEQAYITQQVANFFANNLIPLLTLKFDATVALNFTDTFWTCVINYDTAATGALNTAVNIAEAEIAVAYNAWEKFRTNVAAEILLLQAAMPRNGSAANTCTVWAVSATKFGLAAVQYGLELDTLALVLTKNTAEDYKTALEDLVALLHYVVANGLNGVENSQQLATFNTDLQALFKDAVQWAALKQAGTAYRNWVNTRTQQLKDGYNLCKAVAVERYSAWVASIKAKATADIKAVFQQACPDVQANWTGLTWSVSETVGSNDPLHITITITVPQALSSTVTDLQTCLQEALITYLGASANHVTLVISQKRALLAAQQAVQTVSFAGDPGSLASSVVATFFFLVIALFLHF